MKIMIGSHPSRFEITLHTNAETARGYVDKLTDEQKKQLLSLASLVMSVTDIKEPTPKTKTKKAE